jgi:hypothetical protein
MVYYAVQLFVKSQAITLLALAWQAECVLRGRGQQQPDQHLCIGSSVYTLAAVR